MSAVRYKDASGAVVSREVGDAIERYQKAVTQSRYAQEIAMQAQREFEHAEAEQAKAHREVAESRANLLEAVAPSR